MEGLQGEVREGKTLMVPGMMGYTYIGGSTGSGSGSVGGGEGGSFHGDIPRMGTSPGLDLDVVPASFLEK
jgi:hypothetical protein